MCHSQVVLVITDSTVYLMFNVDRFSCRCWISLRTNMVGWNVLPSAPLTYINSCWSVGLWRTMQDPILPNSINFLTKVKTFHTETFIRTQEGCDRFHGYRYHGYTVAVEKFTFCMCLVLAMSVCPCDIYISFVYHSVFILLLFFTIVLFCIIRIFNERML